MPRKRHINWLGNSHNGYQPRKWEAGAIPEKLLEAMLGDIVKSSMLREMEKVRILDVCSGTQSIERWVRLAGLDDLVEVVSVDIAKVQGRAPTHLTDVLKWDYERAYPSGYFQIVWASPPCTQYSVARTTGGPRDLEGADRIVERCLEIIDYFQPIAWFMENPAWGLLRSRECVRGLHSVIASYCQYGRTFRKDTRFWSNLASDDEAERNGLPKLEVKRCDPATCPAMIDVSSGSGETTHRHKHQIAGLGHRKMPGTNKWNVGRVPEGLLEDMLGPIVRPIVDVPQLGDVMEFV